MFMHTFLLCAPNDQRIDKARARLNKEADRLSTTTRPRSCAELLNCLQTVVSELEQYGKTALR